VVTSAGALIESLRTLGARRIALVAPYIKPLTRMVIEYIEVEGFQVIDSVALEISDNLAVGRHDPALLPGIMDGMATAKADVIVLSACVQMPSLPSIGEVEVTTGKPVITAAVATTYAMLKSLRLERVVPDAGTLVSGKY
jgi:maleate isomerase